MMNRFSKDVFAHAVRATGLGGHGGAVCLALLVLASLSCPTPALGQSREAVRHAFVELDREPDVRDTVQQALRYFRLHPDVLDGLRSAARARAALPLLAAGFQYSDDSFLRRQEVRPTPEDTDESTSRRAYAVTVGGVWDFREAAFNPAEVQVYGLVGVQRDVMLEVTRAYFLRRQLRMRQLVLTIEDAVAWAALNIRVQESTAILDVMTGGWFSRQLERPRR